MKPSISNETQAYLASLQQKADEPQFFYDKQDAIDQIIFDGGLRIKSVWLDKELDLMIILLNNRKIIQRTISDFPFLKNASDAQLKSLNNDGFGIHWTDLDEDLSLRGFLKDEYARFGEKVV